jgi:hypothetical protein
MDILQRRSGALTWVVLAWSLAAAAPSTSAQGLLARFMPVDKVATQPAEGFTLNQRHGPWLIMAATFSGDGADQQAEELALELRRRFNLPAYVHDMQFDYSKDVAGRGIDGQGAPIRRRLQRGEQVHEWAVLVGDFDSVDDSRGQQLLERIKTMQPEALQVSDGEETAQNLADERRFLASIRERLGKGRPRGPMGKAFLTPNPLLPHEYFAPKGVDRFVADMNKNVEHSLLDAPGKYSVQVATFGGSSILQTSGNLEEGGGLFGNKSDRGSALVEAAENAHLLAEELQKHGIEAYEFHDRTESIVAVGSFDTPAVRLPDGNLVPSREAQRVIEVFGAAYNTPSDPLNGDDPLNKQRRDAAAQRLTAGMGSETGQLTAGLNPKHVKILRRKTLVRSIPMDIHPKVIEVPRRSISAAYVR